MEMIGHECIVKLQDGHYDKCYGIHDMKLEIFRGGDVGDSWIEVYEIKVNFCPFCGTKATTPSVNNYK